MLADLIKLKEKSENRFESSLKTRFVLPQFTPSQKKVSGLKLAGFFHSAQTQLGTVLGDH